LRSPVRVITRAGRLSQPINHQLRRRRADGDEIMELFLVLKQYGPMVLVVAFLLWKGRVRETRVSKHIVKLESEYHQGGRDGWYDSRLCRPRRDEDSGATGAGWRPG